MSRGIQSPVPAESRDDTCPSVLGPGSMQGPSLEATRNQDEPSRSDTWGPPNVFTRVTHVVSQLTHT
jgi:hypothetical protein